jgi:hypothetical protein
VRQIVIDNASETPYPNLPEVWRTERLSYAAAIMEAARIAGPADWYVVLSNDVLCTGPFTDTLAELPPCVAGPQLWNEHGLTWIVGWCVATHSEVWDAVGGWDSNFIMSSWEDVSHSTSAVEQGYPLLHIDDFPFTHLAQQQRFTLPGYRGSESRNVDYFMRKHGLRP